MLPAARRPCRHRESRYRHAPGQLRLTPPRRASMPGGLILAPSRRGAASCYAMVAEGFTVALAPNVVAMTARSRRGSRSEKHHLATNKNSVSSTRGGPWTPRFRGIFKKAGMELKDPENIVPVERHNGPHPQRYHERVHERLNGATENCRKVEECRAALTKALQQLASEVVTKGTALNRLVTRGK
ncbi:AHH domain-containing protein [Myxococcus sp. AM001]|nr:AHH domain-containing protein [Myxococcus sp. AM001]